MITLDGCSRCYIRSCPTIEQRIAKLREELKHATSATYVESRADQRREYDRLKQEMIDLEKAHPDGHARQSGPSGRRRADRRLQQVEHASDDVDREHVRRQACAN